MLLQKLIYDMTAHVEKEWTNIIGDDNHAKFKTLSSLSDQRFFDFYEQSKTVFTVVSIFIWGSFSSCKVSSAKMSNYKN